ncbi:MAG: carboxymuconolactone decarboxylase family protein [Chromatiaceae bacterium]
MTDASVPNRFAELQQRYPKLFQAVEGLGQAVREEGPLEEKTTQLIQLAAACALRSEGAVHSHVRRALAAGATADETYHAIVVLASTIGFPNVVAALTWADDILRKKAGA